MCWHSEWDSQEGIWRVFRAQGLCHEGEIPGWDVWEGGSALALWWTCLWGARAQSWEALGQHKVRIIDNYKMKKT